MVALPPRKFSSPPAFYYTEHRTLDSRTVHWSCKHRSTDETWKKAPNKPDPYFHNKVIIPASKQCTDTVSLFETAKSKCEMYKLYCFCLHQMQAVLSVITDNKHTYTHNCAHTHTHTHTHIHKHICIC